MIKSDATGVISYLAKVKIVLLTLAFLIVGGTLWFTHNLVQALEQKDRQIADTYVKSLQYLANAPAGVGDFSFIQGEIITIFVLRYSWLSAVSLCLGIRATFSSS